MKHVSVLGAVRSADLDACCSPEVPGHRTVSCSSLSEEYPTVERGGSESAARHIRYLDVLIQFLVEEIQGDILLGPDPRVRVGLTFMMPETLQRG